MDRRSSVPDTRSWERNSVVSSLMGIGIGYIIIIHTI